VAGKGFPTVGIGTSAEGLYAPQMFLESLPNDDAAFVVIAHLDLGPD
jgi:chemotaxis response regulator CheB